MVAPGLEQGEYSKREGASTPSLNTLETFLTVLPPWECSVKG